VNRSSPQARDGMIETNSELDLKHAVEPNPLPLEPRDILTPQELADRLKVPKSWIYERTRARARARRELLLPCLRLGRYLRFSWSDVCDHIRKNAN
jgi:hypothetical protein